MKFKIATMAAAALLAGTWTANAAMVNYTVGGWSDQFPAPTTPPASAPWGLNGYPGDTVELQSYAGTPAESFDLVDGATYTRKINTLLWTIDYTYGGTATDPDAWSDLTFLFSALRSMTIDGGSPQTIGQGGTLVATYDNDFLSLSGGSTVSFIVQGYQVDVTPLGLAEVGGSNFSGDNPWTQPSRDVMARFDVTAVPEPTTIIAGALLLLPFAASTLRKLRKH